MVTKKELERKIAELESKLKEPVEQFKEPNFNVRDIIDAKKKSEVRAGLVKNNDDGSVDFGKDEKPFKIPTTTIHTFDNLVTCLCNCHDRGRIDCQECYDHPTHLEELRKQV